MTTNFSDIYSTFKDQLVSLIDNIYLKTQSVVLAIIKAKVLEEDAKELFIKFRKEDTANDGWKKDWKINKNMILKQDEKYFLTNDSFFQSYIPEKTSDKEKKEVMSKVNIIRDVWKEFNDSDKKIIWDYFSAFIKIYDLYDDAKNRLSCEVE
jgi:hypothetical protein